MEKKDPIKEDDPNQSEAFRKAVRDLEAAGELSATEESDFDKVIGKVVPAKLPRKN